MNGFYVPDSVSSSYVANKRNEEGSLLYEQASSQVGIQKQAAIQQLEKNYASTIENAYASYLAANRGVQGSNMGQGYKELYNQLQKQQLAENIASAGSQFVQQAQSIEGQEAAAQQQIQQQFQQEVAYFDRVQKSFADYLTYVKSLTNAEGEGYLDPYENKQTIDSMYNVLYEAEPLGSFDEAGNQLGYFDESGKAGLRYEDWVRSQLKDTTEDTAFRQWMFSGGLNEFLAAPKSTKQWQTGELKAVREEEERQAAAKMERDNIVATLNNYQDTNNLSTTAIDNVLIKAGVPKNNLNVTVEKGDYDYAKGQYLHTFTYSIKDTDLSEDTKKILEETGFKVSKDKDGNTVYTNTFKQRKAKNANEFFAR